MKKDFVKIANIKFPIVMEEHPIHGNEVINGKISFETETMTLDKNLPPQIMLETFLHECIHGIDKQYGVADFDEKQTNRMAVGLAQLLIDNPEIMMKFINPCIE